MAVDFVTWLGEGPYLPPGVIPLRAARAWRRIQDKPLVVAFKQPNGTLLAPQTVRMEHASSATLGESAAGAAPVMRIVIFGIRGHESLPNTQVEEGYRFVYAGDEYRVNDLILTHGEVQALCEATG